MARGDGRHETTATASAEDNNNNTDTTMSSVTGAERMLWSAVVCLACAVAFGVGRRAAVPVQAVDGDATPTAFQLGPVPDSSATSTASQGESNRGRMMMKWQTPIFTVNLASVYVVPA
jgi:hypothetical protein